MIRASAYADISTHSLTRRLTLAVAEKLEREENFNSQPHKEADTIGLVLIFIHFYFNSQPHKEADAGPYKSCK